MSQNYSQLINHDFSRNHNLPSLRGKILSCKLRIRKITNLIYLIQYNFILFSIILYSIKFIKIGYFTVFFSQYVASFFLCLARKTIENSREFRSKVLCRIRFYIFLIFKVVERIIIKYSIKCNTI